jgi:hypothetical protein
MRSPEGVSIRVEVRELLVRKTHKVLFRIIPVFERIRVCTLMLDWILASLNQVSELKGSEGKS